MPMPSQMPRFIRLPGKGPAMRFLPLEALVGLYLDRLFPAST
jgi:polyphosphate kinase